MDKMDNEELEKRLGWYEKKYGPYIEKRGVHNYKNLFRKPTMYEVIIFCVLVMAVFLSVAYKADIKNCQSFYEENIVEIYNQLINPDNQTKGVFLKEADLNSVKFKGD